MINMEYEETKMKFKTFFTQNGCKLLEENDDKLIFEYSEDGIPYIFQVCREDIEAYIKVNSNYKIDYPNDCSIMSNDYREVIIEFPGDSFPWFLYEDDDEEVIFGDNTKQDIFVRIGRASNNFITSSFLNKNMFNFSMNYLEQEIEDPVRILDIYNRPFTISIYNLNLEGEDNKVRFSDEMFETCFFEFAYFKDICTKICNDWNEYYDETEEINEEDEEIQERNNFELPKIFYNKELIKFYLLGKSSRFPILEFLTFYQILEYFFVKVSDEKLHEKLSYEIKNPNFRPKESYLAKLIRIMEDHSRKFNETEMLKNVLVKFIDYEDLKKFIEEYEENIDEKIYTKKTEIFGEELEVILKENHIYGNVAKLIKVIRNALVHSSDRYRYERKERYIPFSESTVIVEKHIPLIKFLAEKVIFATAHLY